MARFGGATAYDALSQADVVVEAVTWGEGWGAGVEVKRAPLVGLR